MPYTHVETGQSFFNQYAREIIDSNPSTTTLDLVAEQLLMEANSAIFAETNQGRPVSIEQLTGQLATIYNDLYFLLKPTDIKGVNKNGQATSDRPDIPTLEQQHPDAVFLMRDYTFRLAKGHVINAAQTNVDFGDRITSEQIMVTTPDGTEFPVNTAMLRRRFAMHALKAIDTKNSAYLHRFQNPPSPEEIAQNNYLDVAAVMSLSIQETMLGPIPANKVRTLIHTPGSHLPMLADLSQGDIAAQIITFAMNLPNTPMTDYAFDKPSLGIINAARQAADDYLWETGQVWLINTGNPQYGDVRGGKALHDVLPSEFITPVDSLRYGILQQFLQTGEITKDQIQELVAKHQIQLPDGFVYPEPKPEPEPVN